MSDPAIFEQLSQLLRPYATRMIVKTDTDTNLYLEEETSTGKPQMFAAVQAKAAYVALHVYPAYLQPRLLETVSPQLRARMHGKSCFNFKSIDQVMPDDIADLLRIAFDSLGRATPG